MCKSNYHKNLRILFQNDFGYVAVCSCCNEVQFRIGTVVSFMPEDAFLKLFYSIEKINADLDSKFTNLPDGEKLVLRTPVRNFMLALSKTEFQKTLELFDTAAFKIKLSHSLKKVELMN
ncbi:MAG: DUF6686 family protein [Bacteroidota bacterium]